MRYLIGILLVITVTHLGWTGYKYFTSTDKVGYVLIQKLYDGYKGKQEIEKQLQAIELRQKGILDTLGLTITSLQTQLKSAKGTQVSAIEAALKSKFSDYERLSGEFSNYNSKESKKHVDNLLKQINQYVKDYGETQHYKFILGASGDGSLMYASESLDVTEDVLKYINQRYEDK